MGDKRRNDGYLTQQDLEHHKEMANLRWAGHEDQHAAQERALELGRLSLDERLHGMNEFRRSLEDFNSRTVSRDTFDIRSGAVDNRLNALENFRSRASLIATGIAVVAAAVGIFVGRIVR